MPDFSELKIDFDTRILTTTSLDLDDQTLRLERWSWDGIEGTSLIEDLRDTKGGDEQAYETKILRFIELSFHKSGNSVQVKKVYPFKYYNFTSV